MSTGARVWTTNDTGARTGGTDRAAWVRARHATAVTVLREMGFAAAVAWAMAIALVSHWVRECGWGRSEWRFNVGNMRAAGWTGDTVLLHGGDDSEPRPYRAYESEAEGVRDNIRLASSGKKTRTHPEGIYVPAWRHLIASNGTDGLGWYDLLMKGGWHPWSQNGLDEYRSIHRAVTGMVGEAAPIAGGLLVIGIMGALAVAGVTLGRG